MLQSEIFSIMCCGPIFMPFAPIPIVPGIFLSMIFHILKIFPPLYATVVTAIVTDIITAIVGASVFFDRMIVLQIRF